MSPLSPISQSNIKVKLAPLNASPNNDYTSPLAGGLNRPKNTSRRGFRDGSVPPQISNGDVILATLTTETTDPVSALLKSQKNDPLAFMKLNKLNKLSRRDSSNNTPSIFEGSSAGRRGEHQQKPVKINRFDPALHQMSEEISHK